MASHKIGACENNYPVVGLCLLYFWLFFCSDHFMLVIVLNTQLSLQHPMITVTHKCHCDSFTNCNSCSSYDLHIA